MEEEQGPHRARFWTSKAPSLVSGPTEELNGGKIYFQPTTAAKDTWSFASEGLGLEKRKIGFCFFLIMLALEYYKKRGIWTCEMHDQNFDRKRNVFLSCCDLVAPELMNWRLSSALLPQLKMALAKSLGEGNCSAALAACKGKTLTTTVSAHWLRKFRLDLQNIQTFLNICRWSICCCRCRWRWRWRLECSVKTWQFNLNTITLNAKHILYLHLLCGADYLKPIQ